MHRFDWSDLVTKELLDELREAADDRSTDAELLPVVTAIFRNTGGLAIAKSEWGKAHCTSVGRRLMAEAIGATLRKAGAPDLPGADLQEKKIVAKSRLDVNSADAQALAGLPVIGTRLAKRVIAERRRAGPFENPAEFAARVSGIGSKGADRLAGLLSFHAVGNRPTDLRELVSAYLHGDKLLVGLERLAVSSAGNPHPASRYGRYRPELEPGGVPLPKAEKTGRIGLLEDEAYYPRLLALLDGAKSRLDIAMFYMSLGGEDHPNTKVVKSLEDAMARGVKIRVLLDRDRPDDPYGSAIINSSAVKALTDSGIEVRQSPAENLLHSKCVALDNTFLLIGSHNWTRASFEAYRDVSILIEAPSLATAWHNRFDMLWSG